MDERKRDEAQIEPLTVSATKAGRMLGICTSSVLKLGREGKLPMLKLGPKTFRIPVAAIKRMAEAS